MRQASGELSEVAIPAEVLLAHVLGKGLLLFLLGGRGRVALLGLLLAHLASAFLASIFSRLISALRPVPLVFIHS